MITIQAGYALVVDDEPANRDFVERLLQTASFKVIGAGTGAEALKAAKNIPQLALALVDQELPDATGLDIIAKLRADNPEAILVMATMHDDRAVIDQAFACGADVFLVKPHGFMELYRRLKEADVNAASLRRLVIDQYGPRPYKGASAAKTGETKAVSVPPAGTAPDSAAKPPDSQPQAAEPTAAPPATTPASAPPATSPAIQAPTDQPKAAESAVAPTPTPPAPGPAVPAAKPPTDQPKAAQPAAPPAAAPAPPDKAGSSKPPQ